jgi:hypothetical protein
MLAFGIVCKGLTYYYGSCIVRKVMGRWIVGYNYWRDDGTNNEYSHCEAVGGIP